MARVLIVSNRLPVTVKVSAGEVQVERSSGGLATGLKGPHEKSGGLWIGWPGLTQPLPEPQKARLDQRLADLEVVPVSLSQNEMERYYEGFSNAVLWPLFHYFVGSLPLEVRDFDVYQHVNQRFADVVASQYRSGDLVWIHDYQLMLVPQLLRQRLPDARIGFFLHIPFPSSEVFRCLPYRERILEGMLGADLVGFHTPAYMRHFSSSVLLTLGQATDVDRIRWKRRTVRLGVFPMGVDAAHLAQVAREEEVLRQVREFRDDTDGQVLVGIDRLDYTKGIPRRLLAYEHLLRQHPELRGKVRLVQVAVPSRTNVGAYQEFRDQVDALIGRIHGEFATPTWVPVHYLFRALSEREVVGLYRAADVMLVTPIRDGMNLVAKEFVASRVDEGGVLVLSELAGAATELAEAVHVNPYDVTSMSEAFFRALSMSTEQRRRRMRALRRRVFAYDVHRWVSAFLEQLEQAGKRAEPPSLEPSPPSDIDAALSRLRQAEKRLLLLDYDGTLVPFADTPDQAVPNDQLLQLLAALAALPRTEVHVVSGRDRETLEDWLGHLPVGIHAEHGFWSRPPGRSEWVQAPVGSTEWRRPALSILNDWAARTPGALVEEKSVGLAWHYRLADPEFGAHQANELKLHLAAVLSNSPVEILTGEKVVEIRPHGVHKGRIVTPLVQTTSPGTLFMAMGDDRTDEDLFAALPEGALSVHIGPKPSRAQLRLADVDEARAFLEELLPSPPGRGKG
ncbi:MAG: bifunctional alpha,alpha-trehalose-phosphate synthase (UDP-forming)/trehalose-phosphatase [Myxococcota bacterium]